MDENICRVFTFYSNFLPACTESHNWDYCAFGTIDGIDVGKESIITKDGEALECIWKEHVNFQKKLSGSYNAERIYGVRFGDKKVEEEFWKDEPEYPFLFFTRIQCEGDKLQMLDGGNRQALEHKLSEAGDIKIITYLTYGNSDLFFVIKAREYEDGAQIIHAMNQGMNLILDSDSVCYLKNSFSIMAVKHDWIDEMDDNNRRKLNEKKISASINIIKEPSQDCTELERIIKEMVSDADVQRTSVLGVDDEQIMIKEGGWADFLSLYRKNGGVFCNCNKKYRGIWAGTTTTIYTKLPNIKDKLQNKGIRFCGEMPGGKQKMEKILEKSKERKKWYNNQKKSLLEILKELQTQSIDKNFKEINIILNSVPRYAGELFNDYIFFSILPPLKFLLCLMLENLKIGFLNMRDYYDFLKAFCMYVQGSLASDRHTIQTIDFNSKIYEVPAKLIAFYSAYIHLVKKILSCQEDTNCKEEKNVNMSFWWRLE